ncbi:MAG TPA: glycosyltransferase [Terriglobales bacterium]|nr:glycosyltransferase [Terriglobales bacterium]
MISVIIPAYNEEAYLPRLLDTIDAARAAYSGEVEVIVADNQSTDSTAQIAHSRGCRVVNVERRCIASARNGGAAAARGEVICFVDADYRIDPQTFNVVAKAAADPRFVWGATGALPERNSIGISATFFVLRLLFFITHGDIGVIFCRKADFDALGGYSEKYLFAEDLAMILAFRRFGNKTGRRLFRLNAAHAIMSTRKFDQHGDWHFLFFPRAWPIVFSRNGFRRYAEMYWYRPGR